jgi:flagellar protein FliS
MSQSQSAFQASQAYRTVSVTVSPLRAVVMLLEGAARMLKMAIEAGEARRFEESHGHVVKATTILRGLAQHLNAQKGGDFADQMAKTYHSLIMAALRAYGRPDAPAQYRRIITSLNELREAWSFVLKQNSGSVASA